MDLFLAIFLGLIFGCLPIVLGLEYALKLWMHKNFSPLPSYSAFSLWQNGLFWQSLAVSFVEFMRPITIFVITGAFVSFSYAIIATLACFISSRCQLSAWPKKLHISSIKKLRLTINNRNIISSFIGVVSCVFPLALIVILPLWLVLYAYFKRPRICTIISSSVTPLLVYFVELNTTSTMLAFTLFSAIILTNLHNLTTLFKEPVQPLKTPF